MLIFKMKHEDRYLVTNYKVMFTTLKQQPNLAQIQISKRLAATILLNRLRLNRDQFYLLVRNPYNRIESFFKDKFRQCVRSNEEKGKWQSCQKIFFPGLGLDDSMAPSMIAQKLLQTTFKEFVSLLDETYQKDAHLFPQYRALYVERKVTPKIKLPIRYHKIYKMESAKDLMVLGELFNINIETKSNTTTSVNELIQWGVNEIKVVDKLYLKDFWKFNYKTKNLA